MVVSHGAIIPEIEMQRGPLPVQYAHLFERLEANYPDLTNHPTVRAIEIDRHAIGRTNSEHVKLLQEFLENLLKKRK